ncbi:MAG: DNA alkylation repair protein [Spirochaetales bacterium]|jgi:3-methyladenine DNA glycosylase AlkC|nr:DNA alkylation repair protein [Spirochaetales bacterium]
MAEPLKNYFNIELVTSLSRKIEEIYPDFDIDGFVRQVFDQAWERKELKQRMRHITESLHDYLPEEFSRAANILKSVPVNVGGFEYMFLPDYIELYGLESFKESISALEHFTPFASAEFAVRPFIKKYGDEMMNQMESWAMSGNPHVRRLASEGCRPRLPWAMALPEFKNNPGPILPVLEKLKSDESEYVRRSVANNLNDISKDNPDIVIAMAVKWHGVTNDTDNIIKHGCRTLLKKGNPEILALLGYKKPKHIRLIDFRVQDSVIIGGKLNFSFTLKSERKSLGTLRIEYGIDHLKKNGSRSTKVFKLSESKIDSTEKSLSRFHSFKEITTRKYYTGMHGLSIIVNGQTMGNADFLLRPC